MYSSSLKQSQAPQEEHRQQQQGLTDYEGAKSIARRLFETYDRDKDGVIDNVEVVPMIVDAYRAFNRSFSPARGDIESYSKVLDRDRDGRITYKDIEEVAIRYLCPQQLKLDYYYKFIRVCRLIPIGQAAPKMLSSSTFQFETFKNKKFIPEIEQRLDVARRIFSKIDTDGSGFIEEDEVPDLLKLTYKQMGVTNYTPSSDDVKSWIRMTDIDDDGKISLDEYEFLVLKSLEKAGIRIEYM